MKRSPFRVNPEKIIEWKKRTVKPLKRRSAKQEARMNQAKELYARRFVEHPICEVPGCWKPSTEPHHHTELRRKGNGLFMFRCVCGEHHHTFHHVSPAAAKSSGFLDCKHENDWGKPV